MESEIGARPLGAERACGGCTWEFQRRVQLQDLPLEARGGEVVSEGPLRLSGLGGSDSLWAEPKPGVKKPETLGAV